MDKSIKSLQYQKDLLTYEYNYLTNLSFNFFEINHSINPHIKFDRIFNINMRKTRLSEINQLLIKINYELYNLINCNTNNLKVI